MKSKFLILHKRETRDATIINTATISYITAGTDGHAFIYFSDGTDEPLKVHESLTEIIQKLKEAADEQDRKNTSD